MKFGLLLWCFILLVAVPKTYCNAALTQVESNSLSGFPKSVVSRTTASPANECCYPDMSGQCLDGSEATPCCGFGACNIFCCNCDDGCRHS